jgi:hypothetical protein
MDDIFKECIRHAASFHVGNWLLKPVKFSELISVGDLVLLVKSVDLQLSFDIWNRDVARRITRTIVQVTLYNYSYLGLIFGSKGRIEE